MHPDAIGEGGGLASSVSTRVKDERRGGDGSGKGKGADIPI